MFLSVSSLKQKDYSVLGFNFDKERLGYKIMYRKIIGNRKVVIWGAWYAGKLLKEQFEDKYNIEIDFFVDNKEHGKIDNIRVLTPNVLNKKNDYYFVFISSTEHQSIREQLRRYGYKEGEDYLYIGSDVIVSKSNGYYEDIYGNLIRGRFENLKMNFGLCSCVEIGDNVKFGSGVEINLNSFSNLIIEDNVYIGENTKITVRKKSKLIIRKNTYIDENCLFTCINYSEIDIGEECNISRSTLIKSIKKSYIEIGSNSRIDRNGRIRSFSESTISFGKYNTFEQNIDITSNSNSRFRTGDDCMFSYDINARSNDGHVILNEKNVYERVNDIIIGEHVWLGMRCIILPGTNLGSNCIVGAGSIVNKQYAKGSLIVGVPGRIIKGNISWDRKTIEEYLCRENEENKK